VEKKINENEGMKKMRQLTCDIFCFFRALAGEDCVVDIVEVDELLLMSDV
jgi:hypothetical protein